MSQIDPTDHVLAAIASIMEQPQDEHDTESPVVEENRTTASAADLDDAHGYSRFGPGPLAAMRFKWTVRRENSENYFVDETVGEGSQPIVSGPMSKEAAIRFVDDRNNDACRRFDLITNEMTGRRKEPQDADASDVSARDRA